MTPDEQEALLRVMFDQLVTGVTICGLDRAMAYSAIAQALEVVASAFARTAEAQIRQERLN